MTRFKSGVPPVARTVLVLLFGTVLVYIWNFFLRSSNIQFFLFLAYIIISYLVCAAFFWGRFEGARKTAVIGAFLGVSVSAADLILVGIPSGGSTLLITAGDSVLKVGFSLLGAGLYSASFTFLNLEKNFAFSKIGLILRRIVAALLDMNIILFVLGGLTLITAVFESFGFSGLEQTFVILVEIMLFVGYKVGLELNESQTLGKKIMGLKVVGSKTGVIIRNITLLLFGITMFPFLREMFIVNILYFLILVDLVMFILGRRLFDFISGTAVERVAV